MGTRTISFSLDKQSIGQAIREVQKYRDEFARNCKRLRELIGERIAWSATEGFNSALVSDVIKGPAEENANVQVTVENRDDVTVVFADGEQAIFIEFGAGVYNNGAAGSSPHPWGAEKGFLIGEYGQGKGKRKAWGYYNDSGTVTVTRGTPAAMPMYRGMQNAISVMNDLVREVFG